MPSTKNINNMKLKYLEISISIIIILKILIISIKTSITSFCKFYKYEIPAIIDKIYPLNNIDYYFTTYSGLDTGYGFFAPNVSSNFIILSSSTDGKYSFNSTELLNTSEGKSRFISLNDIFIHNIEHDKDKIISNKIIIKYINNEFSKKFHKKFITNVYLYDYPTLKTSNKENTKLIKIDSIK